MEKTKLINQKFKEAKKLMEIEFQKYEKELDALMYKPKLSLFTKGNTKGKWIIGTLEFEVVHHQNNMVITPKRWRAYNQLFWELKLLEIYAYILSVQMLEIGIDVFLIECAAMEGTKTDFKEIFEKEEAFTELKKIEISKVKKYDNETYIEGRYNVLYNMLELGGVYKARSIYYLPTEKLEKKFEIFGALATNEMGQMMEIYEKRNGRSGFYVEFLSEGLSYLIEYAGGTSCLVGGKKIDFSNFQETKRELESIEKLKRTEFDSFWSKMQNEEGLLIRTTYALPMEINFLVKGSSFREEVDFYIANGEFQYNFNGEIYRGDELLHALKEKNLEAANQKELELLVNGEMGFKWFCDKVEDGFMRAQNLKRASWIEDKEFKKMDLFGYINNPERFKVKYIDSSITGVQVELIHFGIGGLLYDANEGVIAVECDYEEAKEKLIKAIEDNIKRNIDVVRGLE